MKKEIKLSLHSEIKAVWPELEATVFRYSSPSWLKKYQFILHRTATTTQTINPREFRVSEYHSGAAVTVCYPNRKMAKAKAKAKLLNCGEQLLRTKRKEFIEQYGTANI
jgi:hypothetical protein